MPHVPNFPSSDDSETDDDERGRRRDSIIGRIIDDNGFPTPNPG